MLVTCTPAGTILFVSKATGDSMSDKDLVMRPGKDKFRYIKIQLKTTDLSARLWGINTEFVGFIPQSLVVRSIVLS